MGRDRGAEDAGQRAEQLLGQHRAARQLLAGEHGHVRHRPARLEQCLAAPGVVHPGPPGAPPRLVPLEERADVAQRHARAPVGLPTSFVTPPCFRHSQGEIIF